MHVTAVRAVLQSPTHLPCLAFSAYLHCTVIFQEAQLANMAPYPEAAGFKPLLPRCGCIYPPAPSFCWWNEAKPLNWISSSGSANMISHSIIMTCNCPLLFSCKYSSGYHLPALLPFAVFALFSLIVQSFKSWWSLIAQACHYGVVWYSCIGIVCHYLSWFKTETMPIINDKNWLFPPTNNTMMMC